MGAGDHRRRGRLRRRARLRSRTGPFTRVAVLAGRNTTLWVDRGAPRARRPGALGAGRRRDRVLPRAQLRAHRASSAPRPRSWRRPRPRRRPRRPTALRAYSHQPRQVPLAWRASDDPERDGLSRLSEPELSRLVRAAGHRRWPLPDDLQRQGPGRSARVLLPRRGGEPRRRRGPRRPSPCARSPSPRRSRRSGCASPPNGSARTSSPGSRTSRRTWSATGCCASAWARTERELVATLPADQTTRRGPGRRADERIAYLLVAVDEDGLASDPTEPVAVTSVGYEVSATARTDGVHLAWNPRAEEGFAARTSSGTARSSRSELALASTGASFVDARARSRAGATATRSCSSARTRASRRPRPSSRSMSRSAEALARRLR